MRLSRVLVSPEKAKSLLELLKSKNGSGSSKDGDEKIAAFSQAPKNEPPVKHDEHTKLPMNRMSCWSGKERIVSCEALWKTKMLGVRKQRAMLINWRT